MADDDDDDGASSVLDADTFVETESPEVIIARIEGKSRQVERLLRVPHNQRLTMCGMMPCTYELPDNHPLLEEMDVRGADDPCYYLLAIWSPGALQGSFPLNGTYFQINEVFADHASSLQPILVPRVLLWNLRRRFVYFGTSVTSIMRGMTTEEIQACFWRGDHSFSRWKGSIVDSVIGVFLTQNVSDVLSRYLFATACLFCILRNEYPT